MIECFNLGTKHTILSVMYSQKTRVQLFWDLYDALFLFRLDYLRNVNAGIPERKAQRIATMACFLAQPAKSFMTSVRGVNGPKKPNVTRPSFVTKARQI